ncbi:LysE family transporter [Parabacteroides sp. OttesenSCG-928-G07]|nr:LysE family transporter [Parabacteroides sp. OttesenSCG-928-G21]MDL2278889.1 LysE family transporter [Parabacteroides sp. OttesenSCG-928-G07]
MIEYAWKGILTGIIISAPMGPVGILCIQRTLSKGRWYGFITGLGATLSDSIYAIITLLGMGIVINFVETNQALLQLVGSIVLGFFGYYVFKTNPTRSLQKRTEKKSSYTQDLISAFFLTFSNVLIILLYIGLFAHFDFVLPDYSFGMIAGGIGCIAVGAILWWLTITYVVAKLKKWFNIRSLWLMNKIVGVAIIFLAILGFASAIMISYLHVPL